MSFGDWLLYFRAEDALHFRSFVYLVLGVSFCLCIDLECYCLVNCSVVEILSFFAFIEVRRSV